MKYVWVVFVDEKGDGNYRIFGVYDSEDKAYEMVKHVHDGWVQKWSVA